METSILFAQFFALYLLVVSLPMLFNSHGFSSQIRAFAANPGLLLLGYIMALILGLFLVLLHNVWVWAWPVVVTVLCWFTLLKGVINIVFPSVSQKLIQIFINMPSFRGWGVFCLVVALYLGYYGFWIQ